MDLPQRNAPLPTQDNDDDRIVLLEGVESTCPMCGSPPSAWRLSRASQTEESTDRLLRPLAMALTNREIAEHLHTTEKELRIELRETYGRLQVENRSKAIAVAASLLAGGGSQFSTRPRSPAALVQPTSPTKEPEGWVKTSSRPFRRIIKAIGRWRLRRRYPWWFARS